MLWGFPGRSPWPLVLAVFYTWPIEWMQEFPSSYTGMWAVLCSYIVSYITANWCMKPGEFSDIFLNDLKALGWTQGQSQEVSRFMVLTRRKQGLTSFQHSRQYRLGLCPVICLMSSLNCLTPKGEEIAMGLVMKLDIHRFFSTVGASPFRCHISDSAQTCAYWLCWCFKEGYRVNWGTSNTPFLSCSTPSPGPTDSPPPSANSNLPLAKHYSKIHPSQNLWFWGSAQWLHHYLLSSVFSSSPTGTLFIQLQLPPQR